MNRIYRLVWNQVRGCLVVASEIARTRGKHGRSAMTLRQRWLLALPLGLAPLFAMAASPSAMAPIAVTAPATPAVPAVMPAINPSASPSGGRVTAGSGNIGRSGLTTTIDQHSQNLSLNWQSFNIGADSSVNFVQPNAQSIAVNRIADPNGSVILGHLNANGQVFLINPNGVLFGQGAQVNVGGLVASTLDVGDGELGSGTLHFRGDGNGKVINRGSINAANGYVALLGPQVSNQGTLAANGGTVALAGGNAVTLSFDGNRLLSLQVDQSALNALAENRQLIVADGGQVLMSAGAKDSLLASTVNNTGVIQAHAVESRDGKIVLLGGMQAGTTNVAGTLDASAPTRGNGGFIETSAAHVKVADSAHITTLATNGDSGSWLIDPQDFTIAAAGGDMTGSTLGSQLGGGNVIIESSAGATSGNGDIFVNDAVNWSANTLTLTAARNVDINAVMTAGGNAGLALNPTTANGADAAVNQGAVNIMPGLGRVDFTGSGNSLLVNGTPYTFVTSLAELQGISSDLAGHYALRNNIDASATAGWNPDGNGGFAGFEPLGIDDYAGTSFTGVFDGLGHTIDNLTIDRPTTDNVGLFGAMAEDSIVRNVGLRGGSTRGRDNTGSLGGFSSGLISHAYATGNVVGGDNVGGLAGNLSGAEPIDHVYATGDVEGTGNAGGLFGSATNSGLHYAYASGNVRGRNAGGLAGYFESYSPWYTATGDVTGTDSAGGLVGEWNHGTLWYSYASGKVTGGASTSTGGLIGDAEFTNTIRNYWDKDSTGQALACGGAGASTCSATGGVEPIGLDTAGAFQQASYGYFNFADIWYMVDGETRPFLRFEYATSINNAHQLQLVNMDLSASYALADNIDASVADGSRASGMWSRQGFVPLGIAGAGLTGMLDGSGHAISGLTINRPDADFAGLFSWINPSGIVRNLALNGGSITGANTVGSLAGTNQGQISQVASSANVIGNNDVGGLVGQGDGTITQSFASGTVVGNRFVGGLLGNGTGDNAVTQSYASGAVSGTFQVGGLVGLNSDNSTITQSYATGTVAGSAQVGGLVGFNYFNSTITQSYATGAVTGTGSDVGGLVGYNDAGTVTDSYWDKQTTGQDSSAGGSALTSEEMALASHFAGWDVATGGGSNAVWRIYEGHTAPLLRAFMTAASGSASSAGKTYDATAFGDYGVAITGVTPGFWLPGTTPDPSLILGQAHSDAVNAGTYALDGTGLYSTQMGYDLDIAPGTLTIDRAPLILTAGDVSKTYDGNTTAAASLGVNGTLYGNDSLSGGTFAFDNKNAGTHKTVSVSGVTVNDGNGGGNYNVSYVDNTSSTILAKAITNVAGIRADSKVYDGNTAATLDLDGATFTGMIGGDDLSVVSAAGSFSDKNAANGKAVAIGAITLGGADAGNYILTDDTASATAAITPATLTYQADPVFLGRGQGLGLLGGTVSGLVGGDTLTEATDGTLTWRTSATAASPAGLYAIEGGGLSALNYVFVQAPGNATALHLTDNATPVPVDVPGVVANTVAGLQQPDDTDEVRAPYAPDVHIVNGGVRLP